MISSRGEYKFVKGAGFRKIKVDGRIMPLRVGDDHAELRGEDIAFLLEATAERMRAVGNPVDPYEFSREVKAAQVTEIYVRIANLWSRFARTDIEMPQAEFDHEPTKEDHDWSLLPLSMRSRDCYVLPGDEVKIDPIERYFEDVGSLNRWVAHVDRPKIAFVRVTNNFDDGSPESDPWNPSPPDEDFIYAYQMDAWASPAAGGDEHTVSSGLREWRGKTGGITWRNQFAKRARVLFTFYVRWTRPGEYDECRWVFVSAESRRIGSYFIITDDIIYDRAKEAMYRCGVSPMSYPGRPERGAVYQSIVVGVYGVDLLCDLRDRTRW